MTAKIEGHEYLRNLDYFQLPVPSFVSSISDLCSKVSRFFEKYTYIDFTFNTKVTLPLGECTSLRSVKEENKLCLLKNREFYERILSPYKEAGILRNDLVIYEGPIKNNSYASGINDEELCANPWIKMQAGLAERDPRLAVWTTLHEAGHIYNSHSLQRSKFNSVSKMLITPAFLFLNYRICQSLVKMYTYDTIEIDFQIIYMYMLRALGVAAIGDSYCSCIFIEASALMSVILIPNLSLTIISKLVSFVSTRALFRFQERQADDFANRFATKEQLEARIKVCERRISNSKRKKGCLKRIRSKHPSTESRIRKMKIALRTFVPEVSVSGTENLCSRITRVILNVLGSW